MWEHDRRADAQLSIDGAKAAGAAPDENMMKIVMNGALEQKDNAGVQTWSPA